MKTQNQSLMSTADNFASDLLYLATSYQQMHTDAQSMSVAMFVAKYRPQTSVKSFLGGLRRAYARLGRSPQTHRKVAARELKQLYNELTSKPKPPRKYPFYWSENTPTNTAACGVDMTDSTSGNLNIREISAQCDYFIPESSSALVLKFAWNMLGYKDFDSFDSLKRLISVRYTIRIITQLFSVAYSSQRLSKNQFHDELDLNYTIYDKVEELATEVESALIIACEVYIESIY